MKIYVTKYALTEGIEVYDRKEPSNARDELIAVVNSKGMVSYFHGKDWHLTQSEAQDRAEKMRVAKIASLRKSIDKLEKMTFNKLVEKS